MTTNDQELTPLDWHDPVLSVRAQDNRIQWEVADK